MNHPLVAVSPLWLQILRSSIINFYFFFWIEISNSKLQTAPNAPIAIKYMFLVSFHLVLFHFHVDCSLFILRPLLPMSMFTPLSTFNIYMTICSCSELHALLHFMCIVQGLFYSNIENVLFFLFDKRTYSVCVNSHPIWTESTSSTS